MTREHRKTRASKQAPPEQPSLAKGLRIRLKGLRTRQELLAMLHDAVSRLEDHAITHVRGVNLYVTPADADGNPVTPRQHGRKVETITIEEPYRSAAEEHGL